METYYRTDVRDAASELFERELVIANYGSGIYYSLSETATLIWQGLRHGLSVAQVAAWLEQHFAGTPTIADEVRAFADRLLAEGLVIEVEAPVELGELPAIAASTWTEPRLERFDDLQELLLLDPVHDVSEPGWPHRPDDQS